MRLASVSASEQRVEKILVTGLVQGVGFRPTVWRIAQSLHVDGWVANTGEGVAICVRADADTLERFCARLQDEAPPLARIETIQRAVMRDDASIGSGFGIVSSAASVVHTGVVPDAATCPACKDEVFNPLSRRFRYPFTNCTHCGPRLSIVERIPYDRDHTTLGPFDLCAECATEFNDPTDRRFHAQAIACHACGPKAWIERADGRAFALDAYTPLDAIDAAANLIAQGEVVAVKGLGGIQLACDATRNPSVTRLRSAKRRSRKPFALMVADIETVQRYCHLNSVEAALLTTPAAPIVLLQRRTDAPPLADGVAPGVTTLGIMLPSTPLHWLLMRRLTRPIVLTSGNLSDEPQCIDNDEARRRLGSVCSYLLLHDRGIAQRVDDSVTRVMDGAPRVLRRARGYAPAPIRLPSGFERAGAVLALGGELKNTFCLLRRGQAVLSHHIGDLENHPTYQDYRRALQHYRTLFEFEPVELAADCHPEYLSAKAAKDFAQAWDLPCTQVQHHHAHIAACLVENAWDLGAGPVIGVALDGLGLGDDGSFWGGEFLIADYCTYRRVGTFKPVAMLGGAMAIKEPWRNTYAHLQAEMGWPRFEMNFAETPLYAFLERKERSVLDAMLARQINSPLASSCGRLFDAVAAAMGICREHADYEGEAAIALEAIADPQIVADNDPALDYPFAIARLQGSGLPYIEPLAMWQAVLGDLVLRTPAPMMSARFHRGLAGAICSMVDKVSNDEGQRVPLTTVALSGGVFQNKILFEQVSAGLRARGYYVLSHAQVPCNDGGLSLGQAVVAAARRLAVPTSRLEQTTCA